MVKVGEDVDVDPAVLDQVPVPVLVLKRGKDATGKKKHHGKKKKKVKNNNKNSMESRVWGESLIKERRTRSV